MSYERKRLRCCDDCIQQDSCAFSIERCLNRSPDCDHCLDCKSYKARPSSPFVTALELVKARG